MKVEILDVAEVEFAKSIAYYNEQSEGLGYDFAAEIKRTVGRILQYPNAWASLSKRTRRCRTNRFPYGIIYQTRKNLVLIVAIMHLHRDPKHWRDRLKDSKG